ncbi:MAG: hypothetical protein KDF54_11570 [Hydrogenophaga sp.]|nr:hypothetical protein [Hydrogenophaga sp.]
MSKRPHSSAARVASRLTRLSNDVPQVVTQRLSRMVTAGPLPSARDRQEFTGMVMEKPMAFAHAALNMWMAGLQVHQSLWLSWSRTLWQPPWMHLNTHVDSLKQAGRGGWFMIDQGIVPIQRQAASNARRLSRRR